MKILVVFGTRPEAIKMAPIINILKSKDFFTVKVCNTGQHTFMLDQVLDLFEIIPDFNLRVMRENQSLSYITSKILNDLELVFSEFMPDLIMVHGDTATTLAASISGFYHKVKICHIEAGLRTGDLGSPWPEEANRKITTVIADYHFTPTNASYENLIKEGVKRENIIITGNTVIDSLIYISNKLEGDYFLRNFFKEKYNYLLSFSKLILVTSHRRENFGSGIENICQSIAKIALDFPEVVIVYPVHLNPNIKGIVYKNLVNIRNIKLVEPLDYLDFIYLLKNCYLILTDSGGIQEEAPTLNKPVILMRDSTERPEAISAGTVKLVGSNPTRIYNAVKNLILDNDEYNRMSNSKNPFGDGTASIKIAKFLEVL